MMLLVLVFSSLFLLASAVPPYRLAGEFHFSPCEFSPHLQSPFLVEGLRDLAEETAVDRASLPIWEGGFNVKPWLRDHPELLGGR